LLTDTLQITIPIYLLSDRRNKTLFPDKLLTIPANSQVCYVGFRLPQARTANEGFVNGYLPDGCTIVGTTGENLKVSPTSGTTHTVTAPVLAAASSAYAIGAESKIARALGEADAASPSLLRTFSSATTFQISVSDSGNTVAGTGIRLSLTGATAYINVVLVVAAAMSMPPLEQIPNFSS
jgi:hypothetical protein